MHVMIERFKMAMIHAAGLEHPIKMATIFNHVHHMAFRDHWSTPGAAHWHLFLWAALKPAYIAAGH